MEKQFIHLCSYGKLEELKRFFNDNPTIDISAENEDAFRWACYGGHLEVAKWLLEVNPDIDISSRDVW
jgi:hypothetical protein